MARLIDTLPEPKKKLDKKVIILSRSRVGTFSLYQAMQKLGYRPYHMYEVVTGGFTQMMLFREALRAKYLGEGKPYGKPEFDKWLANYDCVIEIPQFFTEEFIRFYPDAKFILTEREVASWTKSMTNTAVPVFTSMHKFPMNVIGTIDKFMQGMVDLHVTLEEVTYHGRGCQDPEGVRLSEEDFRKVSKTAKALAPKDRLLVCRLEDGFGWEQICPFLGKDIPAERYPRGNAPEEFKALFGKVTAPGLRKGAAVLVTVILVPATAIGYWYWQS
ncbi:uncharacterized protein B0I36DRAFT_48850 [Microdochium trichocladiopsis]|uniref:P-loop containing nucleoside triphosphate hydrolase protein n=1 Tax=Microdochium trichocladiopsis TaxID=1682393 RepID=A0A9P9BIB6_9PEZI|nr:uncharacterized protein B0I36DRAFT_48850 [Microdochium trichocladiopsis]KAH7014238.1 hypothetical protein B0I36DRAFT_48850 [Microdochium trichocladiopsis]